ncbi:DUF5685 family protein [Streptomyces tateyamensis]|uniref:DUF5685 family protein n=1 Tax=Streptomyces tateyamensis TaxID=565073 RepID=UPI0015E8E986|nr:DUF5685 family protein [Streptomyces tateyamensis]
MFGIIRPCRHRLSEQLQAAWVAHLCGLCLALRDDHGQLARTATNYDGLIISVLVEAQRSAGAAPGGGRRKAGPCPLRGMRSAEVAQGEGARLAAAVSLALASVKVRDHVLDADGVFARRPVAVGARAVARRWDRQSAGSATAVGFDTAVLLAAAARQDELERSALPGDSVLLVTEPTETATAAAFAHTAVLADRPANAAALREAGRLFGRLAHLLDAAEDEQADLAAGAWNPLTATGTDRAEAERLCRDAVHGIRLALAEVELADRALVHALLAHETEQAVDRVFGRRRAPGHRCTGEARAGQHFPHPPADRKPPRSALAGCAMWALMACTCQLMCTEHEDPWSREPKRGWCDRNCNGCDCSGCSGCGDCCGACRCCGEGANCCSADCCGGGAGGCDGCACDGCCCDGCDGCCCDASCT